MNEKTVDLINRHIDAETTVRESEEMQAILDSDPEAREFFDGIRGMVSEIESLEPADPPAGLREAILNAIRESHPPAQARKARVVPGHFGGTPVFRYVWAIAAGIVFGLVLHPLILGNPEDGPAFDPRNAAGTLGPISSREGVASNGTIITPGERATVTLERRGHEVVVDFDLHTDNPEELAFTFDPSRFAFEGLRRNAGAPRVNVEDGRIGITGPAGSRLQLRFARARSVTTPVGLRLAKAGIPGIHVELTEQP